MAGACRGGRGGRAAPPAPVMQHAGGAARVHGGAAAPLRQPSARTSRGERQRGAGAARQRGRPMPAMAHRRRPPALPPPRTRRQGQGQGGQGRQGGEEEPVEEDAQAPLQRGLPPAQDAAAVAGPQVPADQVGGGAQGGGAGGGRTERRGAAAVRAHSAKASSSSSSTCVELEHMQQWPQTGRGRALREEAERSGGGREQRCRLARAPPTPHPASVPRVQRAAASEAGCLRGDQVPADHRVGDEED